MRCVADQARDDCAATLPRFAKSASVSSTELTTCPWENARPEFGAPLFVSSSQSYHQDGLFSACMQMARNASDADGAHHAGLMPRIEVQDLLPCINFGGGRAF